MKQVLLVGLDPGGSRLASRVDHAQVHAVRSLQEFLDYAQTGCSVGSVVVVARPGDNVDAMPVIYRCALEMRALVTTIVVADDCGHDCCRPQKSSAFLAALRGTSDMMIATSDEEYVQFMAECLF